MRKFTQTSSKNNAEIKANPVQPLPNVVPLPEPPIIGPQPPDSQKPPNLLKADLFRTAANVTKVIAAAIEGEPIKVTKPKPTWWVRTYPDARWWLNTHLVESPPDAGFDSEVFLLHPDLVPYYKDRAFVKPVLLIPTITKEATLFLWQLTLRKTERQGQKNKDDWYSSARTAAEAAITKWVSLEWAPQSKAYRFFIADDGFAGEPAWPEWLTDLDVLITKVFGEGGVIAEHSHPRLLDLLGKVAP
jgi:hypothetical protein